MSDALGRRQVVVVGGARGCHLLVLERVQQILAAVLLVAVLHYGPQRLCPRDLRDARRTVSGVGRIDSNRMESGYRNVIFFILLLMQIYNVQIYKG